MNHRTTFLTIGIGLHCVAVGLVGMMLFKIAGMTLTCVIPAILIGCASVPAVRGRPVSAYVGFGLLMGLSFWMLVSAVNQRDWLSILPVLLLVSGAVWLLRMPGWPSLICTGVAILVCLGLAVMMFVHGPDYDDPMPDRGRKSALTTFGILFLASAYTGLGFVENMFSESRPSGRTRRKKRRHPRYEEEE